MGVSGFSELHKDRGAQEAGVGSAGHRALSDVWGQVYAELRELARSYMSREPRRVTLQPTALVHEAFVKLSGQADLEWNDRAHFFRIAASAMRQILVDHARRRAAGRHGGGRLRIPLTGTTTLAVEDADANAADTEEIDILALEEVLLELAELDERKARVVELRFFVGLTGKQIGHVLGISPKTVEADWYFSRAWLRQRLETVAQDED